MCSRIRMMRYFSDHPPIYDVTHSYVQHYFFMYVTRHSHILLCGMCVGTYVGTLFNVCWYVPWMCIDFVLNIRWHVLVLCFLCVLVCVLHLSWLCDGVCCAVCLACVDIWVYSVHHHLIGSLACICVHVIAWLKCVCVRDTHMRWYTRAGAPQVLHLQLWASFHVVGHDSWDLQVATFCRFVQQGHLIHTRIALSSLHTHLLMWGPCKCSK